MRENQISRLTLCLQYELSIPNQPEKEQKPQIKETPHKK